MGQTTTSSIGYQNKFSTTLSSGITASDTTIPLTNVPTPSEGFLVIEPDSATAWEVIYYTSKTGSGVVCPSVGAGRGQDDSNAASHSSGATVRMDTVAGMFESLKNGTALDDSVITSAKVATGMPVQIVTSSTTSYLTGTTTIPFDNTIPQNTEGDQYLTLSITPKASTNKLVIEGMLMMGNSVINNLTAALFQDSTANALSAFGVTLDSAGFMRAVPILYEMTAGTTSSTTFKLRAGGSAAGTTEINGNSGVARYGGVARSWIKITEYKV